MATCSSCGRVCGTSHRSAVKNGWNDKGYLCDKCAREQAQGVAFLFKWIACPLVIPCVGFFGYGFSVKALWDWMGTALNLSAECMGYARAGVSVGLGLLFMVLGYWIWRKARMFQKIVACLTIYPIFFFLVDLVFGVIGKIRGK